MRALDVPATSRVFREASDNTVDDDQSISVAHGASARPQMTSSSFNKLGQILTNWGKFCKKRPRPDYRKYTSKKSETILKVSI